MARRQDSSSNSSHENQRPTPHNEDTVPEFTDNIRGRGDEDTEDLDEQSDEEMDEGVDEEDEGAY